MTIYAPLVAHGFEWVNTCDAEDYEVFAQFDGLSRAQGWKPVRVRRVRADESQPFNPSDFPWLGGHALVMRTSAVDALRDMLEAHGEILPLATDDGVELFVLNAHTLDALDEASSSITRYSDGRIMWLDRVAFVPSAIEGKDIFRLPFRPSPTYVSERFVQRVAASGLRGLKFDKVWPG